MPSPPALSETVAGFLQELDLLGRALAPEDHVAVRVAPEAIDDGLVPELEIVRLLARLGANPHRLLVNQRGLAVHIGHVEEVALRRLEGVVHPAQHRLLGEGESQRIIAEAREDADRIRAGADEYAVGVLEGLEGDVTKTLQSIQKGIALLDQRHAEFVAQPAPAEYAEEDEDWGPEDEAAGAPIRP